MIPVMYLYILRKVDYSVSWTKFLYNPFLGPLGYTVHVTKYP